ncbi:Bifunctional protein: zinc-containing alcohol dehydrogenase [Labilithrix luteola]|uniref:Bifunctional protein: zinc-containing alcohol dehydrogenase n=2 Tax=Labilithrix luteola TaxID=1391654 RepID=A0A0K1Q9Y6_9BACT|nr:Bifunctional protein: zinc-containing alcohol dehydrogenase [Labilithrix luteola]
MRAIAIDHFGGVEELKPRELSIPQLGPKDVLVRVECAGVGEWDPFEREGGFAKLFGQEPCFPYILGSEGAGVIADVGSDVKGLSKGDRVYATGFLNPKGGFYAQYAAIDASLVSPIPANLSIEQGAVMSGVAVTALRGLDDVLALQPSESIIVFGASGGIGHIAVQLAKRMGARVLAVASGEDGIALAKRLGADGVVDGHRGDVLAAARDMAPDGLDAALLTAGGEAAERALAAVRYGGRVAYPLGVELAHTRSDLKVHGYEANPDHAILERLDALIEKGPFDVHVARTYDFADVGAAHRAIAEHHLGKFALRIP